jgi:hypothetical protein
MIPKYQDIVELIKKGATLEAQEKIMELREAAIELQEENQKLRAQIQDLEKQLTVKAQVEYEKPYYWSTQGEKKDGPYCQVCYDKDQKLIRLQDRNRGVWHCHSCGKTFYDSTYKPPEVNRGPRGGSSWMNR